MVKAIIYRPSMRECELRHRKLGLARNECIFLYGRSFLCAHYKERIKGFYRQVMIDKTIKLDGLSEEDFATLYDM